jgi:hypothetical protein
VGGDHGGPFAVHTGAQPAVWQLSDDEEVVVVEKLGGGGAQSQREGERGWEGTVTSGECHLLL